MGVAGRTADLGAGGGSIGRLRQRLPAAPVLSPAAMPAIAAVPGRTSRPGAQHIARTGIDDQNEITAPRGGPDDKDVAAAIEDVGTEIALVAKYAGDLPGRQRIVAAGAAMVVERATA